MAASSAVRSYNAKDFLIKYCCLCSKSLASEHKLKLLFIYHRFNVVRADLYSYRPKCRIQFKLLKNDYRVGPIQNKMKF